MNRLKGLYCYEIGPIDYADDGGVEWREDFDIFLRQLGVIPLNPCNKPISDEYSWPLNEKGDIHEHRKLLKREKRYDELSALMKPIRNVDLRMSDKADFVIVNYDSSVRLTGTIEEIVTVNRSKKPIIMRCKNGKDDVADWIFAMCPHQMFFDTWQEVKDYLIHVNSAPKVETFHRWFFFDHEKMIGAA